MISPSDVRSDSDGILANDLEISACMSMRGRQGAPYKCVVDITRCRLPRTLSRGHRHAYGGGEIVLTLCSREHSEGSGTTKNRPRRATWIAMRILMFTKFGLGGSLTHELSISERAGKY